MMISCKISLITHLKCAVVSGLDHITYVWLMWWGAAGGGKPWLNQGPVLQSWTRMLETVADGAKYSPCQSCWVFLRSQLDCILLCYVPLYISKPQTRTCLPRWCLMSLFHHQVLCKITSPSSVWGWIHLWPTMHRSVLALSWAASAPVVVLFYATGSFGNTFTPTRVSLTPRNLSATFMGWTRVQSQLLSTVSVCCCSPQIFLLLSKQNKLMFGIQCLQYYRTNDISLDSR